MFFQKFCHFTHMLLWFHLVSPHKIATCTVIIKLRLAIIVIVSI